MKPNDLQKIMRRRFAGAWYYAGERRIYCDRCDVDEYVNPYGVPAFSPDGANSCAIEAAGNALIYYNRSCEGLVPDYRTYVNAHGAYRYGKPTRGVLRMFDELLALSGSNADGTTERGLIDGVRAYVERKGRLAEFTDITEGCGGIDVPKLKGGLRAEKLAIVFFDGCAVAESIKSERGCRTVSHVVFDGRHVALVYGFCDVCCYDGGRKAGRELYLYAENGCGGYDIFAVEYCTVEHAYLIDVR